MTSRRATDAGSPHLAPVTSPAILTVEHRAHRAAREQVEQLLGARPRPRTASPP